MPGADLPDNIMRRHAIRKKYILLGSEAEMKVKSPVFHPKGHEQKSKWKFYLSLAI
jgi:hypothetical protein